MLWLSLQTEFGIGSSLDSFSSRFVFQHGTSYISPWRERYVWVCVHSHGRNAYFPTVMSQVRLSDELFSCVEPQCVLKIEKFAMSKILISSERGTRNTHCKWIIQHCRAKNVWQTTEYRFGTEIWVVCVFSGCFRVAVWIFEFCVRVGAFERTSRWNMCTNAV